jgi:peptide-methionine (R)-S-oxide reductase
MRRICEYIQYERNLIMHLRYHYIEMTKRLELSEEEWRRRLSRAQFLVLCKRQNEKEFSGMYLGGRPGRYLCAGCGNTLFLSAHQFVSGRGWPSFRQACARALQHMLDYKDILPKERVECATCDGHIGYVLHDEYGMWFCANSISLEFIPE